VVLAHGMGTGRWAWADEVVALADEARVIVYDRLGYGDTPAPEGYEGTSVAEQGEDLVGLVHELDATPAVLVGRDLAALACLHVLLHHPGLAAGAVLVDPPLFSLVPTATDALTAERIALGELVQRSGPRAAMEAWLGAPTDAPPRAFFADYGGLATLEVTRRALRAVAVPVGVVATATAAGHVRAATAALLDALPTARPAGDVLAAIRGLLG
jgi:pimeloyl-ACP methyl ester carboxylesterase